MTQRNDLVDPPKRQFEFMNSQIKELEQQNAALVEVLKELLMGIVAYNVKSQYTSDEWLLAISKASKALALVEGDKDG